LFGTDYPLCYEKCVADSIQQVNNYSGFDMDEKRRIMSETIKELCLRFVRPVPLKLG